MPMSIIYHAQGKVVRGDGGMLSSLWNNKVCKKSHGEVKSIDREAYWQSNLKIFHDKI